MMVLAIALLGLRDNN